MAQNNDAKDDPDNTFEDIADWYFLRVGLGRAMTDGGPNREYRDGTYYSDLSGWGLWISDEGDQVRVFDHGHVTAVYDSPEAFHEAIQAGDIFPEGG